MPKICYVAREFSGASLTTIKTANKILEDYAAQGYDLTLRQLYWYASPVPMRNRSATAMAGRLMMQLPPRECMTAIEERAC